jgi:hypothetical protein
MALRKRRAPPHALAASCAASLHRARPRLLCSVPVMRGKVEEVVTTASTPCSRSPPDALTSCCPRRGHGRRPLPPSTAAKPTFSAHWLPPAFFSLVVSVSSSPSQQCVRGLSGGGCPCRNGAFAPATANAILCLNPARAHRRTMAALVGCSKQLNTRRRGETSASAGTKRWTA